jgi:hypothetical protein
MPASKEKQPDQLVAEAASAASAVAHSAATLADLIAAGAEFDVLFVDPRSQVPALNEFYIDGPGTLDRILRIYEIMATPSAAFIVTRIRDLVVVGTELLPRCGFSRPWGIFPLARSTTADIANVSALVVAKRGEIALPPRHSDFWRNAPRDMTPIQIAESLVPERARRLHAFAEAPTRGWTTLIGDNSWIEPPTLAW